MENIIIIAILFCITGSIIWYLYRSKKRGAVCIGCPYSKQCKGHCGCSDTKTENKNSRE